MSLFESIRNIKQKKVRVPLGTENIIFYWRKRKIAVEWSVLAYSSGLEAITAICEYNEQKNLLLFAICDAYNNLIDWQRQ